MRNESTERAHSSRGPSARSPVSRSGYSWKETLLLSAGPVSFPFSAAKPPTCWASTVAERRTPEHGQRRWASPLDCLGCLLFVFNCAAATARGHRGGQTPPEGSGTAAWLAEARENSLAARGHYPALPRRVNPS